jgi:predicted nucleic acid-binding protein
MARTVLADTGLLLAGLHRRDRHHTWARAQFETATVPFATCEAVVSECFFLLERSAGATGAFCELLDRGVVEVRFDAAAELPRVLALIRGYRDLPMSFADACLVRMSEVEADPVVVTTDRQFRVYRREGRRVVPVVMPGCAGAGVRSPETGNATASSPNAGRLARVGC